ncbi:MAG: diguanylate cyclase, partial [Chitinispirillia bacterium]
QKYKKLIESLLSNINYTQFEINHTNDINRIEYYIKKSNIEILLYDFEFQNNSLQFHILKEFIENIPLLALVDQKFQSQAVQSIQAGAQDYLINGCFDGNVLIHVIHSAIERYSVLSRLNESSLELRTNEARLLNVIIDNVDGIVVVDQNKKIQFVNPAAERLLGTKSFKLLNKKFKYDIENEGIREIVIVKKKKKKIVEMRNTSAQWKGMNTYLISLRDITERKRAERNLKINEERLVLAIQGSKDGVWDWNLISDEVYYSPTWISICGCTNCKLSKSPDEWFKRVHPEDIAFLQKQISDHLNRKVPSIENEHRLVYKNGTIRWMVARCSATFNSDGKPIRLTGSLRDITDKKRAEEGLKSALEELKFALASEKVLLEELDRKNKDLVELSITDGLTGLYNHRFIQERFDFEFKRAKRYKTPLSCMMIDIDNFKLINDTYGHQFGDMVLKKISQIIKKNTREVDICGRYGGEEFLIITTQNSEGAVKHASKLHKAIENYTFKNEEYEIKVTVSIGISEFKNKILSKQVMVERSDIALYQAKQEGRNLIRVWKEKEKSEVNSLDIGGISDLHTKVISLSNKMRKAYMESMNALLKAVDAKDKYTLVHSENVSRYAVQIAKAMNLKSDEIQIIKNAGLLHDIGKIGIDKAILTKGNPLSKNELEILKKHPSIGVSILRDVKFLEKEIPIIQHHHEWYNGKGYPQGLMGREIPLGSLILSVADAYDSMSTDREYKNKLSKREIIKELRDGSGGQFFPEIVDIFIKIIE